MEGEVHQEMNSAKTKQNEENNTEQSKRKEDSQQELLKHEVDDAVWLVQRDADDKMLVVDGMTEDGENQEQISLNVKDNEFKLYKANQIDHDGERDKPIKSEQDERESLLPLENGTINEPKKVEIASVTENERVADNIAESQMDGKEENLKEIKNVELDEGDQVKSDESRELDKVNDELDDNLREENITEESDPQKVLSGKPASLVNNKHPEKQDNINTKDYSVPETSLDIDQRSVQFASAKTRSTYPESQAESLQDQGTNIVGVSNIVPIPTFEDNLHPNTGQTLTDRPTSISSYVYSGKDFPTPDYEQYIRPSPSVTESDNGRPESTASRPMKFATSHRDGTKSVTFAEDVKSDESVNSPDVEEVDETTTEEEELFSTAVSEEKIEEATRKLRIGSTDSPGSGNSSLKDACELQNVKTDLGGDILNKRANEHYERGCKLNSSGNLFASIIAFDKAINLCPSEVRFYLMRGEVYLQVTDFQSAIQSFKKTCVLRPTSEMYYSKLAFVYYLQGQSLFDQCLFMEALESFSRAAEMRPEIIGYHTRSIACLAALERHGECLALVNKRLEVECSNPDLYIMRARLHLLFRNTSLSYYDLKDALALDPEQQEAQKLLRDLEKKARDNRDLAVRLQLQEKFKEAMQRMTLAIEMNPSVAEFHLIRGAIHRRLHDFNAAIDDFLLSLDKTDHDENDKIYMDAQRQLLLTYNDFAVDCFLGGHYDEAILLLNKAIKGEKREKGLYVNRGDCFFHLGELHFSLADYHQALEVDPHDSLVRARIAAIHGEFGSMDYEEHNYQDAEARFTVAIQHNPRHSQHYLSRAKVRFMLENHSGARQDILISLHLNPSNEAIHSLLARLFPGKSIADVMRSKAARESKHVLDHLVVSASPVKLPAISRLAGSGPLQSVGLLSNDSSKASVVGENAAPFVLFMYEEDFNKVLAKRKKMVTVEMKSSLHDRQPLKRIGPKLKPQPPRSYELKGGHWKKMDTQPPPGWRQFGLGIEMKDAER